MAKSVKFAVSIPGNEFDELETLRKKERLTRSEFIRETFRLWKEEAEKRRLVKIYEEGYRMVPENLTDMEAWERASLTSLTSEEW
jgi:metal-responsive CopG/Arc/MetJ family transcriptional regulator